MIIIIGIHIYSLNINKCKEKDDERIQKVLDSIDLQKCTG